MHTYRYTLQKYDGTKSRYTCPACGAKHRFTRYIDTETGEHLAAHVGRCDREVNCGYHYKPKQYFEDSPQLKSKYEKVKRTIAPIAAASVSYLSKQDLMDTLTDYKNNHFVRFLNSKLGKEATNKLIDKYHIGTHHHWDCSTVFWQIDSSQRIRTGKVMIYYPHTGKRIKTPQNYITWMHKVLGKKPFNLQQCFFGEHLIPHSTQPIAIAESEKTAIIASHYMTEYTWLASGSLGNLNTTKCKALAGRDIILFPDVGAYDKWAAIAEDIPRCSVNNLFETIASEQERTAGFDIADYLLG